MTELELLRNAVERDLIRWAETPIQPTTRASKHLVVDDMVVSVVNVSTQALPHSGLTFQRCGGGRRVIRRGKSD